MGNSYIPSDGQILPTDRTQMYPVGDTLPVDELDSGSFLLAGPAMSGKHDLLLDLLAEGAKSGEGVLIVTTNRGAESVFEAIEARLGRVPEGFRIVDCVSERGGGDVGYPEERVEYVSSPADLTGIGIGVSEQLRRLAESDIARVRVGFHSLSTLLMYAELEAVFRFIHVLSGRIEGIDGLGFFTLDPTTHDENTVNTLKQLFDGMIELREADGEPEVRVVGVSEVGDEWVPRA